MKKTLSEKIVYCYCMENPEELIHFSDVREAVKEFIQEATFVTEWVKMRELADRKFGKELTEWKKKGHVLNDLLIDRILEKYSHSPKENKQKGESAREDKLAPADICKKCGLDKSEHDEGDFVRFQCPDIDEACEGEFTDISLTDEERQEIVKEIRERPAFDNYLSSDMYFVIKLTEQKIKEKLK